MIDIDARRARERQQDPNERFPTGPHVEWASAEELRAGDQVLQLKLIYEVVSSESDTERGKWRLILGHPKDYREGFRIDPNVPLERNLLLEPGSLYRRLSDEGQS